MTCKDCVHYDLCSSIEGLVLRVILAGDKANERCQLFKPTADVVEVKHGRWIDDIKKIGTPSGIVIKALVGYKCSECGRTEVNKEPYCNCGAKMDGGAE